MKSKYLIFLLIMTILLPFAKGQVARHIKPPTIVEYKGQVYERHLEPSNSTLTEVNALRKNGVTSYYELRSSSTNFYINVSEIKQIDNSYNKIALEYKTGIVMIYDSSLNVVFEYYNDPIYVDEDVGYVRMVSPELLLVTTKIDSKIISIHTGDLVLFKYEEIFDNKNFNPIDYEVSCIKFNDTISILIGNYYDQSESFLSYAYFDTTGKLIKRNGGIKVDKFVRNVKIRNGNIIIGARSKNRIVFELYNDEFKYKWSLSDLSIISESPTIVCLCDEYVFFYLQDKNEFLKIGIQSRNVLSSSFKNKLPPKYTSPMYIMQARCIEDQLYILAGFFNLKNTLDYFNLFVEPNLNVGKFQKLDYKDSSAIKWNSEKRNYYEEN